MISAMNRTTVPAAALVTSLFAIALAVPACGSSGDAATDPAAGGGQAAGPNANGGPGGASASDGGAGPVAAPSTLVARYTVHGTDARGAYEGEAEITQDGAATRFVRTVHYLGLTVEGGRELHWAFVGDVAGTLASFKLTSTLTRADYITQRGSTTHTAADTPVQISGTLVSDGKGSFTGTLSGTGMSLNETWSNPHAGDGKPLYKNERVFLPFVIPTAAEVASNFQLYADYHTLDVIKPYVSRPEFKAAIHGNIKDTTDFDFYRAHPNALRVAEKVIDDISLAETLMRANAYRLTLADKATKFQTDLETRFIDPAVGMVVEYNLLPQNTTFASGDSALWTGTYVATQSYRYQVTGDAAALTPLVNSLNALLTLQEITGDWAHFARSLRKATGAATGLWHAGTGAWSNLEWLEGGNNDMVKGLYYGYFTAYQTLCTGALTGYDAYCTRIRTNAKHIIDDVQYDVATSGVTNKLPSSWLYAAVATNVVDKASYQAQATGYWTAGKSVIQATPVTVFQGGVDWSGTHLSFVGDLVEAYLAQQLNIGGDAQSVVRGSIDTSYGNLSKGRFALWNMLEAAYGTTTGPASPGVEDARWRLREIAYPKTAFKIDRRIGAEFCMSPYPSVPWKQDWMQYPTQDRTQGLAVYPYYESPQQPIQWMTGMDYLGGDGYEATGSDFIHLYWFARLHGLIAATD